MKEACHGICSCGSLNGGHRLAGDGPVVAAGNRFLEQLVVRAFAPATVRAYAFDLANFDRFLVESSLELAEVEPTDVYGYLEWQSAQRRVTGKVVALRSTRPAPATKNRRVAAVRGLFGYLVMCGERTVNPVPAARRSAGWGQRGGMLGHVAVRSRSGGQLVREPSRLHESLAAEDVIAFFADLETHRDRAVMLAMVLGGLRAAEVCGPRLADVDMGLGRVRVIGKGNKEGVVPIDDVFFTECAIYLRSE